jgi:hypothetical protein
VAARSLAAASLAIMLLSGCGSPSDEDVLTEDKIRASESAPELPDVQLSDNPEPPPAPPPTVQPELNELDNLVEENLVEIETEGSIPPAFQALWAMVPSDCRAGDVVGTGMLVTADSIGFADTVGELRGVLGDAPRRFAGRFEYEDGTERREELALSSRNVLIRTTSGQSFTYRRCGAAPPTG